MAVEYASRGAGVERNGVATVRPNRLDRFHGLYELAMKNRLGYYVNPIRFSITNAKGQWIPNIKKYKGFATVNGRAEGLQGVVELIEQGVLRKVPEEVQ